MAVSDETKSRWQIWLQAYPRVIVGGYCVTLIVWLLSMDQLIDAKNQIFAGDFLAFWSAGRSWLALGASQVYLDSAQLAMHAQASPAYPTLMRFAYPPHALYLFAPLGALPYLLAALIYIYGSMALLAGVLLRILQRRDLTLLFLCAPMVLWCLVRGQSSFLLAAMFGFALIMLPRRQVLAGLVIALLTIKPQLGLLLPPALLVAGHYRAFVAASVATLALLGSTLVVFDPGIWERWLAAAEAVGRLTTSTGDFLYPPNVPASVYSTGLYLGLPALPMMVLHALVALLGASAAIWACWQYRKGRVGWTLVGGLIIAATLLLPPYILIYDYTLLLIPLALLFQHARERGPLKHEYAACLALLLLPVVFDLAAIVTGVQLIPLVVVGVILLLLRRMLHDMGRRPVERVAQPWPGFGTDDHT